MQSVRFFPLSVCLHQSRTNTPECVGKESDNKRGPQIKKTFHVKAGPYYSSHSDKKKLTSVDRIVINAESDGVVQWNLFETLAAKRQHSPSQYLNIKVISCLLAIECMVSK